MSSREMEASCSKLPWLPIPAELAHDKSGAPIVLIGQAASVGN